MPTDIVAGAFHVVPSATVTLDPDDVAGRKKSTTYRRSPTRTGWSGRNFSPLDLPQRSEASWFRSRCEPSRRDGSRPAIRVASSWSRYGRGSLVGDGSCGVSRSRSSCGAGHRPSHAPPTSPEASPRTPEESVRYSGARRPFDFARPLPAGPSDGRWTVHLDPRKLTSIASCRSLHRSTRRPGGPASPSTMRRFRSKRWPRSPRRGWLR